MADNIQATPRNYLGGLLSDAYKWMQSPERTQQMQGFAGLLGTTGVPQTIERMAYGEPLTNISRANVPLLKPETADALMTVAPMVGPAARGAETGLLSAGRAGERLAERVVPQVMERGGLPAQLLGDLSQGSRRQMYIPATKDEAFAASKLLKTKTPQEVWKETGVGKYGGEYVKEISDKEATAGFTHLYDVNNGNQLRERAFEHPELYSIAPELKDIQQFGLRENLLSGNFNKIGEGKMIVGKAPTEKDLKTVMAHEMQHGVQDLYGWERGGSIKDIGMDIAENKLKANEVMTKLERMQNVASDEARRANPELIAKAKKWADETGGPWYEGADEKMITKDYLLSQDPVYKSLYQTHADLAYNKPALLGPEETYNRLYGEAQARSTQNRVELTPEERLQYYPFEYKSEQNPYGLDVKPEDLLSRNNGGLLGR